MEYTLKDFDYNLPEGLIAQEPAPIRDRSRLMVLERETEKICHRYFSEIIEYFEEGDCLVLNNTKVIPARLIGRNSAGAEIELFLLKKTDGDRTWEVLLKPARKVPAGKDIVFSNGGLTATVKKIYEDGKRIVEFNGKVLERLDSIGLTPLPPYIKRNNDGGMSALDKERYQTVYASVPGAVAAPTAGLHFTKNLLKNLKDRGVKIAVLTLHVGYGTFKPVEVEDITAHKMHSENYEISVECADIVNDTKRNGGAVFAAGTTSARVLESSCDEKGLLFSGSGETDIFIFPPYKFKIVDKLLTNFHLPKSTLIMMASAFAGKDFLFRAYQEAMDQKYRFYSYGDAMLII